MLEWVMFAQCFVNFAFYYLLLHQGKRHRQHIDKIHEDIREERNALLDRIMANNIHEFKGATGQVEVKRSESGNFLVDRMERSIKKQYQEFE